MSLVIAGCTVGPDYAPPKLDMPTNWSRGDAPAKQPIAATQSASAASAPATRPSTDLATWWTCFNDPTMNRLVAVIVEANHDLRVARERLIESRAMRRATESGRWPQVNANGSYARVQNSQSLFAGGGSDFAGGAGGATGIAGGSDHDFFRAGFDAAWELDVFGGVRRSVEAADADEQSAIEDERAILVSLLAEAAQQYIDLHAMRVRLRIVRRNVEAQRDNVAVAAARHRAGLTTELDVAQAEAQLATTQSLIPELEAAGRLSLHQLAVLMGQPVPYESQALGEPPSEGRVLLRELSRAMTTTSAATQPASTFADSASTPRGPAIPSAPAPSLGVPAALLTRRPDLRRAERELASATALIGVAKADLYPKFSLVGSLGHESISASDFFDSASRYWSIGPTIRWSVFSAGRLSASVDVQQSRARQAALRYEQAALVAIKDVEDALTAQAREREKLVLIEQAVEANRRAVAISEEQYTRGLIEFLPVLVARSTLYRSEDDQATGWRNLSLSVVATYKALGGGWEAGAADKDERARP